MSSVIDAIVDVFEAVVAITLTVTLIGPILALVSEDFKDWYVEALEPIMSLLGITDEDVIAAQVIDQRLMTDDDVKNILTKVALDHQRTQMGIIELLAQYSMGARSGMTNYFDYGRDHYYNGLPDTSIKGTTIPTETIMSVISTEYGVSPVNVTSEFLKVPTKEEYLYYKLNKLYGYQTWTNTLTYSGYTYTVKYMDYNYGTNMYDVTIYRAATVTITTRTEVTVTVTNIDATTDNKHTYTKVTTTTDHSIEGTTIDIVETNVDEVVPIGTVVDSYTDDTVVVGPTAIEYDTTVVSVVAYALKLNYVIQWYHTDNGHIMYWCYELGSGNTSLDNAQRYVAELEMMPIVEIRNNKVNVNSNTTSEAYLDGKAILDFIGMDIDVLTDSINENPDIANITNAYVYFGVDLKDTSPVVAKFLYHSFEFIYDQNMLNASTSTYSAYTTEGNYNSTMSWRQQIRTVVTGSIGAVGTYTNSTSGASITLRKQENASQYIQYEIIDVAATTFIHEGGMWATVCKQLQDGGVVMPISRYMADTLTPLEQVEIFGKALRLSIYSAEVTHLEWYETSSFMNLIKIIITVVGIVLLILSAPAGGSASELAWWALKVVGSMAAAYAFKLLLQSSDSPWLKALYVALAVVALYYSGKMSTEQLGFFTVDQLTGIVTSYTEFKMENLSQEMEAFSVLATEKMDELERAIKDFSGYLSTEFVAELSNVKDMAGYIEGPDLKYYQAIGIQKDAYELAIHTPYDSIKSFYDNAYKIGVV